MSGLMSALAVSRTQGGHQEMIIKSIPGGSSGESKVKRDPLTWSALHCLIAELLLVADYGERLTVREGITSPRASTQLRIVYTLQSHPFRWVLCLSYLRFPTNWQRGHYTSQQSRQS